MTNPLYILGTGVLAEEFFALARRAGFQVEAFVENLDRKKEDRTLCDRPIIWVDQLPNGSPSVCALSTTKRKAYIEQVRGKAHFVNLLDPSSIVLEESTMGEGTVLSAGSIIASHTTLGQHVFVNRGARVGHHTRIGDYATIQPGANIAGLVEIGNASYIGMGAIVIERLKLGEGITVAAGAVVISDFPGHVLVAGNPATIKKEKIDER